MRSILKFQHWLLWLGLLFIVADSCYSFLQFYAEPLDGDMADIILPSPRCEAVLNDPFGISVLTEQKRYTGTNRYFAHQFMSSYFKNVPLLLQRFMEPINSVYASSALFKLFTQLLLLWLLLQYSASYWRGKTGNRWILALLLLIPLFQTNGYNRSFGIINHSISYTFFYAFPVALFLLFFLPYWNRFQNKQYVFHRVHALGLIILAVILSLNGPLINPLAILICPAVLVLCYRSKLMQWYFISPLVLLFVLSIYAYYLGTYNIESVAPIELSQRYKALASGVYYQFTRKVGFPLLFFLLLFNLYLIQKNKHDKKAIRLIRYSKWIAIFTMIWLLLLPLGGYRDYRPGIIRADTLLPVLILIFYLFTTTSLYLVEHILLKFRLFYKCGIGLFLFILMIADEPRFGKNDCERSVLIQLSESDQLLNKVDNQCRIMSWETPINKGQTEYNGLLLRDWNITQKPLLYEQNAPSN